METLKGTGFKGKDECRATPESLLTFPAVIKTSPKTQAQRSKEATICLISILSPFGKHRDTMGPVRKCKLGKSGVTMWALLVRAG